jgi:hypothetical protein
MVFLPLHHNTFGTTIAVDKLVSRVALFFHQAHVLMLIQPYGCPLLLGSFDDGHATLYALEANGQFFGYFVIPCARNAIIISEALGFRTTRIHCKGIDTNRA